MFHHLDRYMHQFSVKTSNRRERERGKEGERERGREGEREREREREREKGMADLSPLCVLQAG